MAFERASAAQRLSTKFYIGSATGPTDLACLCFSAAMARMPNQIDGEHTGLLEQIARCRRLAKEIQDQATVERLLALAAEYEKRLQGSQHE
jgi:hypothetical protein